MTVSVRHQALLGAYDVRDPRVGTLGFTPSLMLRAPATGIDAAARTASIAAAQQNGGDTNPDADASVFWQQQAMADPAFMTQVAAMVAGGAPPPANAPPAVAPPAAPVVDWAAQLPEYGMIGAGVLVLGLLVRRLASRPPVPSPSVSGFGYLNSRRRRGKR